MMDLNFREIAAIRRLNAERRANPSAIERSDVEMEFDRLLREGPKNLTPIQRSALKNVLSTTTGSQGGYTVPSTTSLAVADAMKHYSAVRRMATIITTSTGEPKNFPSSDGRTETGEQLDENATISELDPSFSSSAWNTYKFSSRLIRVPIELVQDSSIDLVGFLERRIASRLGRIMNLRFTTGTGSGQPMGVHTAATVGKVGTTGQTTTVTADDLEDLVHSVDPAYRESMQCGWMMADTTLTFIAKLKDSSAQPLKLVKYGSRALNTPTTLLGYPVEINPDMPAMGANVKSILFGDFAPYTIRDALGVTIYRFADSAFVNKGQIGFLGLARSGGAYVDIGGAIKAYQNSAS